MNNFTQIASELALDVAKQTEEALLEQLSEFVRRDLIVVEQGPLSLVQNQWSDKFTISRPITLKLKDQAYIESLERQIEELKLLVVKLREAKP